LQISFTIYHCKTATINKY